MRGWWLVLLLVASVLGLASLARAFWRGRGWPGAPVTPTTSPAAAALPGARPVAPGSPVLLRIFKQEAELEVWVEENGRFRLARTFPICAFSGDPGPKLKEGDGQAPEGFYEVGLDQLNPNSHYHLAFNLGFPNAYDRAHGRTGSFLMVHGGCVSVGCYAMTDAGIEQIYGLVEAALRAGQRRVPVHAFPFRMTAEAMARQRGSRWEDFWQNLREGDALFARTGRPPRVSVAGKRYVFLPG